MWLVVYGWRIVVTHHVYKLWLIFLGATEDFSHPLSLWIRLELNEFICYFTPEFVCYFTRFPKKIVTSFTLLYLYKHTLPAPATKHQSLKRLLLSPNRSKNKKKKKKIWEVKVNWRVYLSSTEARRLIVFHGFGFRVRDEVAPEF